MLIIEKIAARVPGFQRGESHGRLVPTRRIIENLAPTRPGGGDVSRDFIERRLGIETVALSHETIDFLERCVWSANGRPFADLDRDFRLQKRGGVVNESLMALVSECMEAVLPAAASERAKICKHIHISVAPPADMDRDMGRLRRKHGLPEFMPTEYVSMACPALPAALVNVQRIPVATEVLCLITGDQNMLPFVQQYATLADDDRTEINRWLYVAAFGEATGAALVRLCPHGTPVDSRRGWEVLSVGVDSVPGLAQDDWRGVIADDGAMNINVKNVIPTYKAAMQKQVPLALRAIAARNHPDAPAGEYNRVAIPLLHRYCFHESNFNLLPEMAREHSIPEELVPGVCNHTGSPVGMSAFVTLAAAVESWDEDHAAGKQPRNVIAASIVGQAGINVGCAHIALQATPALRAPHTGHETASAGDFMLTEAHVRRALQPLCDSGDMRAFLDQSVRSTAKWRIMGSSEAVGGTYDRETLWAHWQQLMTRLHPNPYRLVVDSVVVDPETRTGIVEMHGDAAFGDDSGRYQQWYCWIMIFDDGGQITELRAYLDTAVASSALRRASE